MSEHPLPESDPQTGPTTPAVSAAGPWIAVLLAATGILLLCVALALVAATG